MKVFILQRVVWDHCNGEIRTIIKVHSNNETAQLHRQSLQESDGRFGEFRGIDFEVEEFEVV